jgi:hypothetical protein
MTTQAKAAKPFGVDKLTRAGAEVTQDQAEPGKRYLFEIQEPEDVCDGYSKIVEGELRNKDYPFSAHPCWWITMVFEWFVRPEHVLTIWEVL